MGHDVSRSAGVQHGLARSQLRRLTVLIDATFAVALVLVVQWMPELKGGISTANADEAWAVVVGVLYICLYWLRNNALVNALERTDGLHTVLSIFSLVGILLVLYAVHLTDNVGAAYHRAAESAASVSVGVAGGAAWAWACRRSLTLPGLTREQRRDNQAEALVEPLAAAVSVPFAFVGELPWVIALLSFLPIGALIKHRRRRHRGHGRSDAAGGSHVPVAAGPGRTALP